MLSNDMEYPCDRNVALAVHSVPCHICTAHAGYNTRHRFLNGMAMITIYHNPRCSKSREALWLVEAFAASRQVPVEIIEYLKTPLTVEQLSSLQRMLGCALSDMARSNEDEFSTLGLAQAGEEELLRAIAAHPKLLQRPIVVQDGRAVIARPPERVHALLADE